MAGEVVLGELHELDRRGVRNASEKLGVHMVAYMLHSYVVITRC